MTSFNHLEYAHDISWYNMIILIHIAHSHVIQMLPLQWHDLPPCTWKSLSIHSYGTFQPGIEAPLGSHLSGPSTATHFLGPHNIQRAERNLAKSSENHCSSGFWSNFWLGFGWSMHSLVAEVRIFSRGTLIRWFLIPHICPKWGTLKMIEPVCATPSCKVDHYKWIPIHNPICQVDSSPQDFQSHYLRGARPMGPNFLRSRIAAWKKAKAYLRAGVISMKNSDRINRL